MPDYLTIREKVFIYRRENMLYSICNEDAMRRKSAPLRLFVRTQNISMF